MQSRLKFICQKKKWIQFATPTTHVIDSTNRPFVLKWNVTCTDTAFANPSFVDYSILVSTLFIFHFRR
jgi:hypothetical protein